MSIVQFPVGKTVAERAAFRRGVPATSRLGAALQLVQRQSPAMAYCAACAAPIDYGAVWRGEEAYCSVECSLGGTRPA
ncbi:MAG TPA: hypothetical protein VKE27_10645 [Candidatus Dormibacteraeota bacterium]|nr:hypothetical protein [Candidatus Dormibacteraeota bacterium]